MDKIHINYSDVNTKTAEIRSVMIEGLRASEFGYRDVITELDATDGGSTVALSKNIQDSRVKSVDITETLAKLNSFVVYSSGLMEAEELRISNTFKADTTVAINRAPITTINGVTRVASN